MVPTMASMNNINRGAPDGSSPSHPIHISTLCADKITFLQAARADIELLAAAVLNNMNTLDIGLKRTIHRTVGVAD